MSKGQIPESQIPFAQPRHLLGAGPSKVNPSVIQAMIQPMIGHLDPDFILVLEEVAALLKQVFKTQDATTFAVSGTGSAGMQAGITSLLEPGDTVVMCVYGFFCERMVYMAERVGANVIPLRSEWGRPFPEEMLQEELKRHTNVKLVTAVHAETSTGILQPLEGISRLASAHDALFMVDAVTSLGGNELAFDDWGIDYCFSASQKCMGCPPGLSPVALSPRASDAIENRDTLPSSYYLDLALISKYWGVEHAYHHTAPTHMILALHEGLRVVLEEGLERRFARHQWNAMALRVGLEALGLSLVVPEGNRLAQITPIWIPEGVDDDAVRNMLLRGHNIEIGKGIGEFAGKVWRIGLMGESSNPEYILDLLVALEDTLPKVGFEVAVGDAAAAARKAIIG